MQAATVAVGSMILADGMFAVTLAVLALAALAFSQLQSRERLNT